MLSLMFLVTGFCLYLSGLCRTCCISLMNTVETFGVNITETWLVCLLKITDYYATFVTLSNIWVQQ